MDAVFVGEAVVDLTPGTTADGRDAHVPVLGGAPFNAATAAARLGASVAWSGPLGDDASASRFRARMRDEGIDDALVVEVPEPNSLALIDVGDDGVPSFAFYLDGTANRSPDAVVPALPDGVTMVVSCGAIGLDDPPYGLELAAAVAREGDRRPVWLDPNVRPTAAPEPARTWALLDGLVRRCALVKVAVEDLEVLVDGGPTEPMDVARAWATSGPGLVVVTLGPDGIVALRRDGSEVRVAGRAVDVVDTVGAGDTVTGTLVAELAADGGAQALAALPDERVRSVLELAVRAASVTVGRTGADPPVRDDVPA